MIILVFDYYSHRHTPAAQHSLLNSQDEEQNSHK